MIRRFYHRMKDILFYRDMTYTEALLCAALLCWAFVLLWSNPTLLETSPSYAPMHMTMPQFYWGVLFLLAASVKLIGLVTERLYLRVMGAALGSFLWGFVATSFFLTIGVPTGFFIYGLFALTSLLLTTHHARTGRRNRARSNANGSG